MKDTLVEITSRLIRFQSVQGHKDLERCAKWLEKYIRKNTPDRVEIRRTSYHGTPSVMAVQGEWKHPQVLLLGHIDVVEGAKSEFSPTVRNGRLYGRGAADMKAGVASLLHTFTTIVQERPDLSVGIMLTGDEEHGGADGAGHLVNLGWKADEIICLDGGYGESISHAEKGILRLKLVSKGDTGRVHHRWEGNCALEGIVDAYGILQEMFPHYKEATEEDNWHTTFTPKAVVTSPNGNAVMDRAEMSLSVHFTHHHTAQSIVDQLRERLPGVEMQVEMEAPSVYVDPKHPSVQTFKEIWAAELGKNVPVGSENGASDARYFSHLDIPMIITKPLSGNPEQKNEWVNIASTVHMTTALLNYLRQK